MGQTTAWLHAEFKADIRRRQIEGYASVFGNVDLAGDVVVPGAYRATIRDDMPAGRIKVKRNHDRLIGKPVHAEEDRTGLLTVSHISPTALGDETLALVEDGVIDCLSIGYVVEDKAFTTRGRRQVRELRGVRLLEWSFLDDPPANPEARVLGVKACLSGRVERMGERAMTAEEREAVTTLRAVLNDLTAYVRSRG